MSRSQRLRLADIVEACERVIRYTEGFTALSFARDLKTQDAVIRQFVIIGEAVKTLPAELTQTEPSVPWSQIAGFRDVLTHAYFAVDPSVVWDAAKNKVPSLKIICEKFLSQKSG